MNGLGRAGLGLDSHLRLSEQIQHLPIDRSIVIGCPLDKPLVELVRYPKRQAFVCPGHAFLHNSIIRDLHAYSCITCAARILVVEYVHTKGDKYLMGSEPAVTVTPEVTNQPNASLMQGTHSS